MYQNLRTALAFFHEFLHPTYVAPKSFQRRHQRGMSHYYFLVVDFRSCLVVASFESSQ